MNMIKESGTIDLNLLIRHFPWKELCRDYGFAIPYPEVMMTSDRAHALYTQISGLLLPLAWELDNEVRYRLEAHPMQSEAELLFVEVELKVLDEAWEVIGFPRSTVERYLSLAAYAHLSGELWAERKRRYFGLDEGSWLVSPAL
ncbi:hypothetical protein HQ37_04660 [Porphyromonas sp. COT-239 OH1446]|nr:hypothetical protein HQ37_04660 [Porphyromonas sp. COT-239 OH1446]